MARDLKAAKRPYSFPPSLAVLDPEAAKLKLKAMGQPNDRGIRRMLFPLIDAKLDKRQTKANNQPPTAKKKEAGV